MKQVTNMSRLVNQLEKTFKMLNKDFFNNELPMPIITCIPSSRSYAHYVPANIWEAGDTRRREVNIASGTLDRPLESIVASLVHEMVHMYNDLIANISDTSRNGTYHNRYFAIEAEKRGLIVTRSAKWGWAHSSPSEELLLWVLEHDELREIEICRRTPAYSATGVGAHSNNGGELIVTGANTNSHSRKYQCPKCHNSVRATKCVNIICGDCMQKMIYV